MEPLEAQTGFDITMAECLDMINTMDAAGANAFGILRVTGSQLGNDQREMDKGLTKRMAVNEQWKPGTKFAEMFQWGAIFSYGIFADMARIRKTTLPTISESQMLSASTEVALKTTGRDLASVRLLALDATTLGIPGDEARFFFTSTTLFIQNLLKHNIKLDLLEINGIMLGALSVYRAFTLEHGQSQSDRGLLPNQNR